MLIVVGSGVSLAATGGDPVAGWPGLLRSGLEHLLKLRKVSKDWADRRFEQIRRGDVATLVEVAQEVRDELPPSEYRRWLEDSVGSLQAKDPSVLLALARLEAPIATTNYDNLIEDVTRKRSVTWQDPSLFIREPRKVVLHLHGHRDRPESIVLGTMDYASIATHQVAQEMQRALSLTRTLLLVGFGAGLDDPNFEALRTWMREVWGDAGFRHYRLCLEQELPNLDEQHKQEQIYPLPYGTAHKDLARYLNALGDELGRPAGKLPWLAVVRARARSAAAAVPARLRRQARDRRRSTPRAAILGLVVVAAVLAGLATWAVRDRQRPAVAAGCPIPLELVVLTTRPRRPASASSRSRSAIASRRRAAGRV